MSRLVEVEGSFRGAHFLRYTQVVRRAMPTVHNPSELAHKTFPMVLEGNVWKIWEFNIRTHYKPGKDFPPWQNWQPRLCRETIDFLKNYVSGGGE